MERAWKAIFVIVGLLSSVALLGMSVWWADALILSVLESVTLAVWLAGCLAMINLSGVRRAIACGAVVASACYWLITMGPWFTDRIAPCLLTSIALQELDSWASGHPDCNIHYVYSPPYALGGHWDKGWGRERPPERQFTLAFAHGSPDPSISQAAAHWVILWAAAGVGGVVGWLLYATGQARAAEQDSESAPVIDQLSSAYRRFSLRQLLALVTFAAFACGMLVHANDWGGEIVITATCLLLVILLIALLVSQHRQQQAFAGGWLLVSIAYLAGVLAPWASSHIGPKLLPTRILAGIESLGSQRDQATASLDLTFDQTSFNSSTPFRVITFDPPLWDEGEAGMYTSFQTTGHWLLAIVFGYLGGILASSLARIRHYTDPSHTND